MNTKFLHGLFIAFITLLSQAIFTTGHIPNDLLTWEITGVTVIGSLLIWVSQSFVLPTTSVLGSFNWRDIIKGAIVAIGNFLAGYAATLLPGATLHWDALFSQAVTVLVMYLVSQFAIPKTTTT